MRRSHKVFRNFTGRFSRPRHATAFDILRIICELRKVKQISWSIYAMVTWAKPVVKPLYWGVFLGTRLQMGLPFPALRTDVAQDFECSCVATEQAWAGFVSLRELTSLSTLWLVTSWKYVTALTRLDVLECMIGQGACFLFTKSFSSEGTYTRHQWKSAPKTKFGPLASKKLCMTKELMLTRLKDMSKQMSNSQRHPEWPKWIPSALYLATRWPHRRHSIGLWIDSPWFCI